MRGAIEIDGGTVLAYGHYGRPVVAFPSESGESKDWESQGMVDAITGLLDAGEVKLKSTKRCGSLLAEKGIRHEVDLWGHDVPHDWPSWRAQIAHHLPRFC
jgi:esterase/lipase superfamily enzyme